MAIYTALRRATAAAVPLLSCRASATSSRTFHSAIAVNLCHKETTPFVPSDILAYCVLAKTFADDILLREINCALEDNQNVAANLEFPGYFPFEVVDNPGEKIFQLKRQFEDETITVQVDITPVSDDEVWDDRLFLFSKEKECQLVVSIFKGNGVRLEFGMIAFHDYVTITRLSLKKPDESEEQLVYNRKISILDENLEKAILKYLKIRGITPKITKFLQQYMFNEDKKEYSVWLKNLKSFIEK